MVTVSPADAPSADVEHLIRLVAVVESTQRTEDVDGFLALFHPDAVWVNGAGRRLVGRDEIAAFTRTALPGAMADATVSYDVQHVRFLSPDIALTGVLQEYFDGAGRPTSPRTLGRPTYTWARDGTDWRIVAGQNTTVVEAAPDDVASAVVAIEDGFTATTPS